MDQSKQQGRKEEGVGGGGGFRSLIKTGKRVEHQEINNPPKAPEKLDWLLKCKSINQGNKQGNQEEGSHSTEYRQQEVCGKRWIF